VRARNQNCIGGKWVDAVAGGTYRRHSPYDQSLVGVYQGSDEVDAANAMYQMCISDMGHARKSTPSP
jgi:acyl-CoA reductase-like NAD-dependent aldehyde dehydrogenase